MKKYNFLRIIVKDWKLIKLKNIFFKNTKPQGCVALSYNL